MILEELLSLYQVEVRKLFFCLSKLIERTIPSAESVFFEGWKSLGYGTGKSRSAPHLAVYLTPLKDSVNLGFYSGSELTDPAGLLKGSGKKMRHIKFRPGHAIPEGEITLLILQAYNIAKAS